MTTQIAGPIQGNKALFLTRYKLLKGGIRVAYPFTNGFVLFNGRHFTFNPQDWSKYEVDLYYFDAIRISDLHIVCNETATHAGLIDYETALSILCAMLHSKSIVLTKAPSYHATVDDFARQLIERHLGIMQQLDLPALPSYESAALLQALPKRIDYGLTGNEQALIRSRLKEHFRDLLQPTRALRIYHARRPVRAAR